MGTIVERADDYLAPVCHHFGDNHLPDDSVEKPLPRSIGGCTLCDRAKVPFIDELDPEDNVNVRLAKTAELREPRAHHARGRVGGRRHRRR